AVGGDGHVADLTGGESAAAQRLSAGEQARADTAADLDEHDVVTGPAEGVLGQDRRVGVVRDDDRQLQRRSQYAFDIDVRPSEVGCGQHHPAVVDDTGRAHPDPQHGGVRIGDEGAGQLHDGVEDLCRVA